MPRAFLVKKARYSPGKRNWSEQPDHERGYVYIPGERVRRCVPLINHFVSVEHEQQQQHTAAPNNGKSVFNDTINKLLRYNGLTKSQPETVIIIYPKEATLQQYRGGMFWHHVYTVIAGHIPG